jgi:uncharacterized membrane protein (UPF0127 family)
MRFPIDAVFFDRQGFVTKVAADLRPWRIAWSGRAYTCLELASGGAAQYGFRVGQRRACFARDAIVGRRKMDLRHPPRLVSYIVPGRRV